MPRKRKVTMSGWPLPDEMLRIEEGAAVTGVSRDTLERARDALMANPRAVPKVRNEQTIDVGRLYAKAGRGAAVQALKIYKALGIDPAALPNKPPPTTPKKKAPKPKPAGIQALNDEELLGDFWSAVKRAAASMGGPAPLKKIRDMYDELASRGLPPQGMLHGLPLSKIGRFTSLGDFFNRAKGKERWPFILPRAGGRPVDLLSAKLRDWRLGDFALLTVEEWHRRMAEALSVERSKEHARKEVAALKRATARAAAKDIAKPVRVKPAKRPGWA